MQEIDKSYFSKKDQHKIKLDCGLALGSVLSLYLLGSLACEIASAKDQVEMSFISADDSGPISQGNGFIVSSDRQVNPGQKLNWGLMANLGLHRVVDIKTRFPSLQIMAWYCDPKITKCLFTGDVDISLTP